jgi:hypothetical protein
VKDLTDYSGEFEPGIKYERFSKDVLAEALRAFSKYIVTLDGLWYLTVKEMMGNEKAVSCDMRMWEKVTAPGLSMLTQLFKFENNTVADLMKMWQVHPFSQHIDYGVDLRNDDHAILTVRICPTLIALEKEAEGRDHDFCGLVHRHLFKLHANLFDRRIEVRSLRLPPRASQDEICCQWEFKLER